MAQAPVIHSTDFPSTVGTKLVTNSSVDETLDVDVGTTGGPQTWDFTAINTPESITQYIVNKSTTPFADSFPTANLVTMLYFDVDSISYFYSLLSSSQLTSQGSGFDLSDTSWVWKYQRSTPLLNFPVNYNDVWYWATYLEFEVEGVTQCWLDSAKCTYDAWGTVAIPLGNFECARVKSEVTIITEAKLGEIVMFTDTSKSVEYAWFSPGHGYIADITSFGGEEDPNFTQAEFFSCLGENLTGVEEQREPEQAFNFTLRQNYPNPFNPQTKIEYYLFEESEVELSIYNALGQKVKTLIDQHQIPGGKEVFWDGKDDKGNEVSSGIYFYKLKTNAFYQTKKMLLLR
jgi:hypothetical protein